MSSKVGAFSCPECRPLLVNHLLSASASSTIPMRMINSELPCDGCGRLASADHIARRLQRLEWATRYRPIHINLLLLGAVAPTEDSDLIYSLAGDWRGEAKTLLTALGVTTE